MPKIIEIPATLRLTVPDDTTPEQIERLVTASCADAIATVDEGVMEDAVKEHIEIEDKDIAKKVIHADLWVNEQDLREEPIVHEI